MQFGSFHSWVFYLGKDGFQVSQFNFFHPLVSDFLAPILSPPYHFFFRGWGYLDAIALHPSVTALSIAPKHGTIDPDFFSFFRSLQSGLPSHRPGADRLRTATSVRTHERPGA